MTLRIEPGEHIVVTGPSGAGKSSLLALLLRFAEPTGGAIARPARRAGPPAGGGPGRALARADRLGAAAGAPVRRHGRRQHRAGPAGASPGEIREAARLAGADRFIAELADGYQTPVGERGSRLSSGQRQMIAVARAFLRDAPLVLLDEPAAHLDPFTAAALNDAIAALMTGRTVIHVTHSPRPAACPRACWPCMTAGWPAGRARQPRCSGCAGRPAGPEIPARSPWPAGPPLARRRHDLRHPAAAGTAGRGGRGPVAAVLGLAGPWRWRLLGAALAGAAATGCAIALLAVSGFLLARASQHPGIVAISAAVVAVRGLSVGRAVFRYLERLGSHDVAFRVLGRVRVSIYRRLERWRRAGWRRSARVTCWPG